MFACPATTQRLDFGASPFESRRQVERFTPASFRDNEPTDQLLCLVQHLRELGQPLRALGGRHVNRYSGHINPPVVRSSYVPVFLR